MPFAAGFTELPLPVGSIQGAAYAVSADGSTIVGYVCPAGDTSRRLACYWTSGGGLVTIGSNFTEAYGVSGDGSVIVGTTITTDYQPFIWTSGGGLVTFGSLGDRVYGISADGSRIVGTTTTGGLEEACYWDRSFSRTTIGYLPGDNRSRVLGVSADGTFITGYSTVSPPGTAILAILWTAAGGMVSLGLPVGDPHVPTSSRGFGVSNDGSIVAGDLFLTVPITTNGAFRWTSGTGMVQLPIITGNASTATGVSGDGSTIAGYSEYPGSGNQDFAYWTSAGITVPVPPSFSASGTYPTGVSGNGGTFAGYTFGTDPLPFVYIPSASETLTDADLFFQPQTGFVDFSVEANRRLFIDANGCTAFLGTDGIIPFGSVPPVFLTRGPAQLPDTWAMNAGNGGTFVITGGDLTAAGSMPCCSTRPG